LTGYAIESLRGGHWTEIGRSHGAQQPASAIRMAADLAPGTSTLRIVSPDGRTWTPEWRAHRRRWREAEGVCLAVERVGG
jgi:hypothetical protein